MYLVSLCQQEPKAEWCFFQSSSFVGCSIDCWSPDCTRSYQRDLFINTTSLQKNFDRWHVSDELALNFGHCHLTLCCLKPRRLRWGPSCSIKSSSIGYAASTCTRCPQPGLNYCAISYASYHLIKSEEVSYYSLDEHDFGWLNHVMVQYYKTNWVHHWW